jgi:hypothetical protein
MQVASQTLRESRSLLAKKVKELDRAPPMANQNREYHAAIEIREAIKMVPIAAMGHLYAQKRTRVVTHARKDMPGTVLQFMLLESFCPEIDCDCGQVNIDIIEMRSCEVVASYELTLSADERTTVLTPNDDGLDDEVWEHLASEVCALAKSPELREHNRDFKEALRTPGHPIHAWIKTHFPECAPPEPQPAKALPIAAGKPLPELYGKGTGFPSVDEFNPVFQPLLEGIEIAIVEYNEEHESDLMDADVDLALDRLTLNPEANVSDCQLALFVQNELRLILSENDYSRDEVKQALRKVLRSVQRHTKIAGVNGYLKFIRQQFA